MYDDKEEAERCIEIAEKSMQSGNWEKAIRFLQKAQRFYPTNRAKELLEKWKNMPSDNEDCSKEHLDAVKRVKRCKNYYEALGVSKDAVDSDIKKAYKKLALQLHPDKNKTPGAAEAFKEIGNAVAVLTDPEKRKQYDLYLTEDDRPGTFTTHRTGEPHYRGFEADMTPEELFNFIFSGAFSNSQNVYVRRNGRWPREETPQAARQQTGTLIMNLIPIFIVLFLSLMSSFFVTDPIYSLHESTKFSVARKTQNLKVPYFVKENFHHEYQGSLRRLELTVEEDYVNNLKKACYKEKSYRDSLIFKARNFENKELLRRAHQQPMPSCEALMQIHQD